MEPRPKPSLFLYCNYDSDKSFIFGWRSNHVRLSLIKIKGQRKKLQTVCSISKLGLIKSNILCYKSFYYKTWHLEVPKAHSSYLKWFCRCSPNFIMANIFYVLWSRFNDLMTSFLVFYRNTSINILRCKIWYFLTILPRISILLKFVVKYLSMSIDGF